MPGGRPRKPLVMKIADGTYRADRDGPLDAQVHADGSAIPPEHLNALALAFWGEVVPGLIERGLAAACDSAQLSAMCEWWARYRLFSEQLDGKKVAEKHIYQMTILCGIAWTNFDKIAGRFGLTPSDRAKLHVQHTGKSKTPVAPRKRG